MSDFTIGYKIPTFRLALTIQDYLLDYDESVECSIHTDRESTFLFVKDLTMYTDSVKWFDNRPNSFSTKLLCEFNIKALSALILFNGRKHETCNNNSYCNFIAEQNDIEKYVILKHPLRFHISSKQYTLSEIYKEILCLK